MVKVENLWLGASLIKAFYPLKKTKLVQNFSTLDGNQSFFYNIGSQGPKMEDRSNLPFLRREEWATQDDLQSRRSRKFAFSYYDDSCLENEW